MGHMRPPHPLKENKGTELPQQVIFFDTETTSVEVEKDLINHQLKLGVACYYNTQGCAVHPKESWLDFNEAHTFWNWALKHVRLNSRMLFVAHNLSFDFLVLNGLTELEARSWYVKSLIIYHTANIWTFVQYKCHPDSLEWRMCVQTTGKRPRVVKSIVFLDLMNYFKTSLAELGKSMGTPKWKIDFDTCTWKELAAYCRNDVFIMVEAWKTWTKFIETHDLGTFGKTLPSQAFNAYRHRFMPHKIYIHSHTKALALERSGYFGGRCECFRLGHYDAGPYYLLDVNSMYSYVMRKSLYPTKLVTYISQGTVADLEYHIDKYAVIATVLLKTPDPRYPVRLNKRLTFPTGTFWTTLTTGELRDALDHRAVLAVRDLAIYDKRPIFADYVSFFWNLRKKFTETGNKAYRELCKRMLNLLYGKFGQKLDDYTEIAKDPGHKIEYWRDYDVEKGEWLKFKCIDGKVSVATGHLEAFNSFPAISAHVTAYARLELLGYINRAGEGHAYYCDTDSIIVDTAGHLRLIEAMNDTELGALHLEKMSDTMIIRNVKDYTFASKRKVKGVMSKATQVSENVFGQWQQVSLRSVLWNNYTDNCFWKYVEKHLRQEYKKGIVREDGIVTPYVLTQSV